MIIFGVTQSISRQPAQKLVTSYEEKGGKDVGMKLSRKWVNKMKKLPESGMGYQNVKVKLKDGTILKGIVTNSDTLQITSPIRFSVKDIQDINTV